MALWKKILENNKMFNTINITSDKVIWNLDKKQKIKLLDKNNVKQSSNKIKLINFNMLATHVSHFKTPDYKKEDKDMLELRYNNIAKILLYYMYHQLIDIINMQELDGAMYLLLKNIIQLYDLPYIIFFNKYFIKKNKLHFRNYDIGVIINKKKFEIEKIILKNITPDKILNENSLYTTKRSKKSYFCQLSIKKTNKKIINVCTHLSGQPQRPDIRYEEMKFIKNYLSNFKNIDNIFISGDFNDENYNFINEIIANSNLNIFSKYLNDKSFIATSFHKINLVRETQKMEHFHDYEIFKTIDFLISNVEEKKINYHMMPNQNSGIFGYEVPYNDILIFNKKNNSHKYVWPSDHTLIIFNINIS